MGRNTNVAIDATLLTSGKTTNESLLQNNRQLLTVAVFTTVEAIRRYPGIHDLFFPLLAVESNPTAKNRWLNCIKAS